ncbi:M20 family metallopeptidase [Roseomonas marmotae]|uniref:M20 family metallopeptidase n=1 Tax=Roseomonas marmotae TaxID=2768161 RepID=A0ABS3K7I6_9PROT|nr:M20 family metallopeptidase [Roseomonas marmotae]MBO1073441.1 M20 family metallopeptidase [Roseomonas marmotae]QTI80363.1 M20 family metallopeptidase [Roseomonas marmotae]
MPATRIGTSQQLLEELRGWVEHETPTTDAAAINGLMDKAEAELRAVGAVLERIPGRDGFGDHLVARTPGEGKPVLVAGHLDTVWNHGTLASTIPFRVEGEKAYGPGIYDMKAGSFFAFHSVREILRQKVRTRRPITLLLTSDEEVGSPSSRALIEAEARKACAVLIPEPAGNPGKACVTARKGVGRFVVTVKGQSAHAGGNWSEGASAVVTLARLITQIHALVDLPGGTTTNCAPIWGGTRPNVIAPEAGCEVDFRTATVEKAEALVAAVMAMAGPQPEGTTVTITGGLNRPPMEEGPGNLALYEKARGIAARIGYDLPKQHRGGGSDGNFTAALGIPTLDGLGCSGAGAHAEFEHILWEELAPRCALLCELLETLEG